jgi:hypothetical protein
MLGQDLLRDEDKIHSFLEPCREITSLSSCLDEKKRTTISLIRLFQSRVGFGGMSESVGF